MAFLLFGQYDDACWTSMAPGTCKLVHWLRVPEGTGCWIVGRGKLMRQLTEEEAKQFSQGCGFLRLFLQLFYLTPAWQEMWHFVS